jgi:hypothetical protein
MEPQSAGIVVFSRSRRDVDTQLTVEQVYFSKYNNTFYVTGRGFDGDVYYDVFYSTTDGINIVYISLAYSGLNMATDGVTFVMQTSAAPLISTPFPPTSSSEWTPIEVPFAPSGRDCGIVYVA